MICANCWQEIALAALCPECKQATALAGAYRLLARLGGGGSGVSFKAERLSDERAVCVKAMPLVNIDPVEAERLFRREAAVLKQLEHPQIPAYLDDFTAGEGAAFSLYLVQELVLGENLEEERQGEARVLRALRHPQIPAYVGDFTQGVGPGFALYLVQELVDGQNLEEERQERRPAREAVLDDIEELLGIVGYLHGLEPPVVHRDIKPSNIMRRKADGRLVLIDFGLVKDSFHASFSGGLSVQGTFGYMAPEQFAGQAEARSDLYAIGKVAVALLTGKDGVALADEDGFRRWREGAGVSEGVANWVDKMTALAVEERYRDAGEALRALRGARSAPNQRPAVVPANAVPYEPAWQVSEKPAVVIMREGLVMIIVFVAVLVGAFYTVCI